MIPEERDRQFERDLLMSPLLKELRNIHYTRLAEEYFALPNRIKRFILRLF